MKSGRMPSVMNHSFSKVPSVKLPRSSFDRSHGFKTTFDADYLVPFFIDEVIPGDTKSVASTIFARLATPEFPIMDNMYCDTFFFFVPSRLTWDNWQKFCGEQVDPDDSTDFLTPIMTSPVGGYAADSLSDYFGLPTLIAGLEHRSEWHRAYNLIWNKWFRDENLQDSVVVDRDDGPDSPTDYVLLKRGKRHDYFTSCLPFPQKGPAVTIPLGDQAPVIGIGKSDRAFGDTGRVVYETDSGATTRTYAFSTDAALDSNLRVEGSAATGGNLMIYADLSEATAATLNAFREANAIQSLYERDARGGTRYPEINLAHFGVVSSDARMQYPEYLGGGSTPVIINPIAQTSGTPVSGTPQGNLAAMGLISSSGHGFTKSFTEHGVIIGLMSVRADLTYQQGMNRMFSRRSRFEFYWPDLAHLGEQAVLNKEIYAQGPAAVNPSTGVPYDEEVFGYQERWAEYRYKPSLVTGKFRSNHAQSLDAWLLTQDFGALPELNDEFIESDTPLDRVIAVPSESHFICDVYTRFKDVKVMPTYSVPGLKGFF